MGLVKMLIYEGFRNARTKAATTGPKSVTMKQLGKAAVTRSDFDQLADHVENMRNDMHKGMTDLFSQSKQNDHYVFQQLTKLADAVNSHHETLKQLVDVIKAHGLS